MNTHAQLEPIFTHTAAQLSPNLFRSDSSGLKMKTFIRLLPVHVHVLLFCLKTVKQFLHVFLSIKKVQQLIFVSKLVVILPGYTQEEEYCVKSVVSAWASDYFNPLLDLYFLQINQ